MKILILDVPALHLGYLGCYGNDWVATPNLDRFASEGVVFDRHFFDCDQPLPLDWTGHLRPAALAPTLGQILTQNNVQHRYLEGAPSLSAGSLHEIVARTLADIGGNSMTWTRFSALTPPWQLPNELLDSYCEEEDLPWPAPPCGPVENADDLPRLQNTYAAVVTFADAQVGVLLDSLRTRQLLNELLVCVVSCKGLPLGEHGMLGQSSAGLYEELVHLPLLMRLPHAQAAGLRVAALTQPVDLFPTLLRALAVEAPPNAGCDLWPLLRGDVDQVRAHAYSCIGTARALRTPEWAFLLSAQPHAQGQLFVKPEDRWEVNDVRQHHLELAEQMQKEVREL